MTTTWRYALSKEPDGDDGDVVYAIREVYLDERGGLSYTENAISPAGESLVGLTETLLHVLRDMRLPMLDMTLDPPKLVPSPFKEEN